MNPTTFPEQTRVLQKPPSMSDEECQPLAIHDTGDQLISCWQPSQEDRQRIMRGEPVWLGVVGRGHPPVWLSTTCPFPREAQQAEPICATCPYWKDTLQERRLETRTRRENAYAARVAGLARGAERPAPPRMDDLDRFPPGGDCARSDPPSAGVGQPS